MNQKQRTRKRAKELGISYQQAYNMYRPQKSPQIEKEETYEEYRERVDDEEYEAWLLRDVERILAQAEQREQSMAQAGQKAISPEIKETTIPQLIKGDL